MKKLILLALSFTALTATAADYYNNSNDEVPALQVKQSRAKVNITGIAAKVLFQGLNVKTVDVGTSVYKIGKNIGCFGSNDGSDDDGSDKYFCQAAFDLDGGQAIEID